MEMLIKKYQIWVVYWPQLFWTQKLVENKISNHDKYITTLDFNKLIAETFTARLKESNLGTKIDFDEKRTRFNRKITSKQNIWKSKRS